jgi:hypothetical protein
MAPARAGTWQPFIWDGACAPPRATHPDDRPGNGLDRLRGPRHPYSVLLPVGFTVPPLLPEARWALTPPFHPYPARAGRFAFCGTFPEVALAGRYPAPCFRGARTFLPSLPFGVVKRGCPANWQALISRDEPQLPQKYAGRAPASVNRGNRQQNPFCSPAP